MKAIKKAGQKMRHVNFNKNTKSFFKDTVITFNHYKIKIKKARPGTGITANPLVSLILNYSGIENACVKIINKPDILLLIKHLSKFLHGN